MAILARTVLYNGAAALLATLIAIPAALVIGRGRGVLARLITVVLPLALVMPSISYTCGWLQFFRLIGIAFEPAEWGDILRCIWTLASWLWALPAIAMGIRLRLSDSHIQEQAMLDGGLWRITYRMLLPAMVASCAMSFVLACQEFAVYERSGISVVATEIRTVFETGAFSENPAAIAGAVGGTGGADNEQGRHRPPHWQRRCRF